MIMIERRLTTRKMRKEVLLREKVVLISMKMTCFKGVNIMELD